MQRGILERFRAAYGDWPFALLLPEWIEALLDVKPPHAARYLARDIALVVPVCGQARLAARGPDAGHQAALDQERRIPYMDRGRDRAIRGASSDRHKPRLGLALLLYTAQRRSDVVRMGRQHIRETDGPAVYVKQHKTGVSC